jgi:hypothetical protein
MYIDIPSCPANEPYLQHSIQPSLSIYHRCPVKVYIVGPTCANPQSSSKKYRYAKHHRKRHRLNHDANNKSAQPKNFSFRQIQRWYENEKEKFRPRILGSKICEMCNKYPYLCSRSKSCVHSAMLGSQSHSRLSSSANLIHVVIAEPVNT